MSCLSNLVHIASLTDLRELWVEFNICVLMKLISVIYVPRKFPNLPSPEPILMQHEELLFQLKNKMTGKIR